jgi:SnoaL-like domain
MGTFDRAKAREDIARIHLAYPEYVDRGDIDGVVGLFAGIKMGDDATPDDELPTLTADDVRKMYSESVIMYDGRPRTQHVITNMDIQFNDEGTKADLRSYFLVYQATDGFPLQLTCSGKYLEKYEDNGEGWKLKVRRDVSSLLGDLSHHCTPQTIESMAKAHQS